MWEKGRRLSNGINEVVDELGIADYFQVLGMPCNLIYATKDQDKKPSQLFRTLFLQETIKRAILMPSLVVSFSHTDKDIESTVERISESLWVYKEALEEGIEKHLVGRPVKPVLRQYN